MTLRIEVLDWVLWKQTRYEDPQDRERKAARQKCAIRQSAIELRLQPGPLGEPSRIK